MALADFLEHKPVLRTERVTIRQMRLSDVPALKERMPDRSKYACWGKPAGKTDKNPELLFEKNGKTQRVFTGASRTTRTARSSAKRVSI
jgi:ribosomal-protein-alanine N-acetyltransferase